MHWQTRHIKTSSLHSHCTHGRLSPCLWTSPLYTAAGLSHTKQQHLIPWSLLCLPNASQWLLGDRKKGLSRHASPGSEPVSLSCLNSISFSWHTIPPHHTFPSCSQKLLMQIIRGLLMQESLVATCTGGSTDTFRTSVLTKTLPNGLKNLSCSLCCSTTGHQ